MEPRFTVTTIQDKDAYHSTVVGDYILNQKTPTAVFYVVAVLLGAFLWWGSVFRPDRVAPLPLMIGSAVVTLAICICAVPYLDRFAIKRVSARILKATLKSVKDLDSTLTFAFDEEGFTLDTPAVEARRTYDRITDLRRTQNHLLLFQGRDFCFAMARTAVPQGLEGFLQEKCGKPFRDFDV